MDVLLRQVRLQLRLLLLLRPQVRLLHSGLLLGWVWPQSLLPLHRSVLPAAARLLLGSERRRLLEPMLQQLLLGLLLLLRPHILLLCLIRCLRRLLPHPAVICWCGKAGPCTAAQVGAAITQNRRPPAGCAAALESGQACLQARAHGRCLLTCEPRGDRTYSQIQMGYSTCARPFA